VQVCQIRLSELLLSIAMLLLGVLGSQSVPDAELHDGLTTGVHELAVRVGVRVTAVFSWVNAAEVQLWADYLALAWFMATQELRFIITSRAIIMAVTPVSATQTCSYLGMNKRWEDHLILDYSLF
jgi:hypothetical protein